MPHRQVSTLAALLFLVLFATLVLLPEIVYWLFRLQENELGDFLSKRAGVLFLGLSILCFYSRNTKSIEVENTVALSVGTAMGAMALLGVYELVRGNAGLGILVAVIVELSIAALFSRLWFKNRTAA
jgi:hypothetical protein